jgi:hypothetical protein
MAEPTITEVQEHVIEMDGIKYHLVDAEKTLEPPDRNKHQSWCWRCAGHELAQKEDEDRLHIFDHYCYGHRKPLLCDPDRGIVYVPARMYYSKS